MKRPWQGRCVLVTGAAGITGRVLVEELLALGAVIRATARNGADAPRAWQGRRGLQVIAGDLGDRACCVEALSGVDEVMHLASCRRNVSVHHERSGFFAQANVAMTMALLAAMESRPAIPVTFFSTGNISAALDPLTLQVQPSIDGYAAGKYAAELLWLAAAREKGFPLLVLRPAPIYGPGDSFTEDGNVIPSLIVKAARAEDHLRVWGSGQQERSFLYVNDLVGALLRLLDHGVQGVQYVGPPERTTVAALATRIRNLVKPSLPLEFDTSRPEGLRQLAHQPVHSCLEDYPWTPLEEGLRHTAAAWAASR